MPDAIASSSESVGSRPRRWFSRWTLGGLVERAREHQRRTVEVAGVPFAVEQAVRALDALAALESGRLPTRRAANGVVCLEIARQALSWALLAHARSSTPAASSLSSVKDRAALAELLVPTGGPSAFAQVSADDLSRAREAFAERTFAEDAERPPAHQAEDLRALRTVAEHAVLPFVEADGVVLRAWLARVLLLGAILAAVAVAVTVTVVRIRTAAWGPNVALSAGVLTSSTSEYLMEAHGTVDGDRTAMGFHTKEENDPWVRVDLGKEREIRRVVVYNRTDCCQERPLPLELSVSLDGNEWRTLDTRTKGFTAWQTSFAPVRARYVRLLTRRKTMLHLAEVEVYEH